MIGVRCIFAGYLIAALAAMSLTGPEVSLAAVLIAWFGGGCLAAFLAVAWHLLVPEDEPREEQSADGCQLPGQHLVDGQMEAA